MQPFGADTLQIHVHQIQRGGLPTLAELLQAGAPRFALSLIAFGGLCWLVTYIDAIRVSAREKVTTIPFVAVALNLTWEVVHSVVYPPPRQIDLVTNFAWLGLDLLILIQVFQYGRARQTIPEVKRFWPLVVLATLVLAFEGHVTFHRHVTANSIFPDESGAIPAFIINLVMSVLFISMYFQRTDGCGLSKRVAWGKFLGTACYSLGNTLILQRIPEVTYLVKVKEAGSDQWFDAGQVGNTTIHPGFLYFLFIGITIFDLIYLMVLYRGRPPAPPPPPPATSYS